MRNTRFIHQSRGHDLNSGDAPSDTSLIDRLRNGDGDAIAALFRRHASSLLRVAASLTDSSADAEDVVQDVFVGLQLALQSYEERGAFAAWLRGVTVRTALASRRRRHRRLESFIEAESLPAATAINHEQRISVQDALHKLPSDMRDVFVLKVVEGYSHDEIAELLGIRSGTSEVRLFRAIRRLRALLTDAS